MPQRVSDGAMLSNIALNAGPISLTSLIASRYCEGFALLLGLSLKK